MNAPEVTLVKKDLTQEQLDFYLSKEIIAVDTELMGLKTHRDRLCLIQIGDEDRNIVLVQIEKGQREAPNLKKLFESDKVKKLFHYARTDVAAVRFWLDIKMKNFFCTKIGSKIARTYTDKHSLRELTKEVMEKDLNKTQQSSDWGASDLTKDQLKYAATDVYYLIPIYNELLEMLKREDREELAVETSNYVSTMAELDILGYKDVLEH